MAFTQPDSFQIGPFEVRKNPSPAELAEKLNRLREAVEQVRLQPGPGYLVNRSRGGTTLQILSGPGGGSAGVDQACPLEASLTTTTSGYTVTVAPGTINGLIASNYLACMSVASSPLSGTTASAHYVVADAVTDGKQLTSWSLDITSSAPAAPTPTTPLAPTTFEWPLAVVATSGSIYQLAPCAMLNALVEESVTVAGTLSTPYDNAFETYYYWIIR